MKAKSFVKRKKKRETKKEKQERKKKREIKQGPSNVRFVREIFEKNRKRKIVQEVKDLCYLRYERNGDYPSCFLV